MFRTNGFVVKRTIGTSSGLSWAINGGRACSGVVRAGAGPGRGGKTRKAEFTKERVLLCSTRREEESQIEIARTQYSNTMYVCTRA